MRIFLAIIFLFFCCFQLYSQVPLDNKRDYEWVMGYHGGLNGDSTFHMVFINEGYYFVNTLEEQPLDPYVSNTSMCDTAGQLLFFSNGIFIVDKYNETIENGDSLLIDPDGYDTFWGLELSQALISLPLPNQPDKYVVVQQDFRRNDYPINPVYLNAHHLFYSLIDMSQNNAGVVLEKKQILINDTIAVGALTACRHANGRDWWIIQPGFLSKKYYRLLLTPVGFISLPPDTLQTTFADGGGQSFFTPDGTKYVRFVPKGGISNTQIEVYEFNRCTGLLSNPIVIPKQNYSLVFGCVSPNSRFAYLIEYQHIFQYDLTADDISASEKKVATYDGFHDNNGLATNFALGMLAPDGKIYIMTGNGTNYLNVINNPNKKGTACNVLQHSIELPSYNFTIPHFPFFRLGPIDGSPCDTLGLDNPVAVEEVKPVSKCVVSLFPNPATEYVMVKFSIPQSGKCEIRLYNALGELALQRGLNSILSTVYVRDLPEGVYYYQVLCEGRVLGAGSQLKIKN